MARSGGVWDLGVRLFHWALVASVSGALITGFVAPRPWLDLHLVFGGIITTLIVYRLVWGFTGTTYARLASFVVAPWTALNYAVALLRGRAPHHIGHNPLGATMIIALGSAIIALSATGLIALGGVLKDGPLAPITSYAAGITAKGTHEALAFALLTLIAGHLIGIFVESLRTHENLVRSMISGQKRLPDESIHYPKRHAWPKLTAAVVLALGTTAAIAITTASQQWPHGVSTAALDATYVKECAACHTAYHPSLATKPAWTLLMADLGNHFGDNAELDPALEKAITAYLSANSAETADTQAAHIVRGPDDGTRLRITDAKAWRQIHTNIAVDVFASKPVSGKHNCAACHADAASGLFKPRSIAIPKEPSK